MMFENTPSTEFGQSKKIESSIYKIPRPFTRKLTQFCSSQHMISDNGDIINPLEIKKIDTTKKSKCLLGYFNSLVSQNHCCFHISENILKTDKQEKMIGPLTASQRNEKIRKFKEKKKQRLSQMKIRYVIRKLNAKKKMRIKGRFIKEQAILKVINEEKYKFEIPIIKKPIFSLKKVILENCSNSHQMYHIAFSS